METATYIYCQPEALETIPGCVEVDEVLSELALELGLGGEGQLRVAGGNSVTVPNISPEETWAAMDRIVPLHRQRRLFYLPRL